MSNMYNVKSKTLEAIDNNESMLVKPQTVNSIVNDRNELSTGTLTNGVSGRGVFRKKKTKKGKKLKRKTKGCVCK